jgi:hypothetical protein
MGIISFAGRFAAYAAGQVEFVRFIVAQDETLAVIQEAHLWPKLVNALVNPLGSVAMSLTTETALQPLISKFPPHLLPSLLNSTG